MKKIYLLLLTTLIAVSAFAGNPDRQGEAGASELLFNPWARSAGLHSMTTSTVSGVEAMRLNVAGIGRIESTEFSFGTARLYEGSDLNFNALGFAKRVGESGAFAVTMAAVDFGDIVVTTEDQPGGTGGTFSPSFFHFGLGYSHTYANKISVGLLVRGVFESITDVSGSAFAVDAGVQYVSGDNDEFRLGISLRNIGSPMSFEGEGLSFPTITDEGVPNTLESRSANFELPSALNIGLSYDFAIGTENKLRAIGNFTSNAFSRDQIGGGLEFILMDNYTLRGGYKLDFGSSSGAGDNIYTGLAAGASANFTASESVVFGLDYAYRTTNPFRGSHNITLRIGF